MQLNLFHKSHYFYMSTVPTSPEVYVFNHNSVSGFYQYFFQTLLKCPLYTYQNLRSLGSNFDLGVSWIVNNTSLPLYTDRSSLCVETSFEVYHEKYAQKQFANLGDVYVIPVVAYSPNIFDKVYTNMIECLVIK